MPGITNPRIVPEAVGADPWQIAKAPEYPSPDGTWTLRFSDQWELRMGLPYWQKTQLIREGRDLSAEQHLKASLGTGARPMSTYVPWSAEGDKVLITALHSQGNEIISGFFIQDTAFARPTVEDRNFWLRAGVWSPTDDLVLLVTEDVCRIVTGTGVTVASAGNPLGWKRAAAAGWTPSGQHFFCAGPDIEHGTTALRFFDPSTGEKTEQVPIDPDNLVPWDRDQYRSLDRDGYLVSIGRGTRGVARLLDDWTQAWFSRQDSTLYLAVYRPTSPVQPLPALGNANESVMGCYAENQWLAVDVVD